MPTDNRATAERIARDSDAHAEANDLMAAFARCQLGGPILSCQSCHAVAEGALRRMWDKGRMAHRDRTAERDAARKAWDVAMDWVCQGRGVDLRWIAKRDAYLAAEFDAGERTECERCGGLMPAHERQYAHHQELAACVDFLAATIKRLASQRGAER